MSKEYVVVWREAEGSAVRTYADPDKGPRVFADSDAPEAVDVEWVDQQQLDALLKTRDAFEARRVPVKAARALLGWDV